MKGGQCIYFNEDDNICAKGVSIVSSFGAEGPKPCLDTGEQAPKCPLHRYPTTRELYKANEGGRLGP